MDFSSSPNPFKRVGWVGFVHFNAANRVEIGLIQMSEFEEKAEVQKGGAMVDSYKIWVLPKTLEISGS